MAGLAKKLWRNCLVVCLEKVSIGWRLESLGITCPQLCFSSLLVSKSTECNEKGRVKNVHINSSIRNGFRLLFQKKKANHLKLFSGSSGDGGGSSNPLVTAEAGQKAPSQVQTLMWSSSDWQRSERPGTDLWMLLSCTCKHMFYRGRII